MEPSKEIVELPMEILLHILSKIPLLDRLQLRVVCKKWSVSIFSISCCLALFQRKIIRAPVNESKMGPGVILDDATMTYLDTDKDAGRVQIFVYNQSWHKVSSSFIPEGLPHNPNCYVPINSAGGLLVFQEVLCKNFKLDGKLKFIVCNPALRTWVALPEVHWVDSKFVSNHHLFLHPKEKGSGFLLVLAPEQDNPGIFDTETGAWIELDMLGHNFSGFQGVVMIQGIIYMLAFHGESQVLITFNTVTFQFTFSTFATVSKSFRLFVVNGKLVLIGCKPNEGWHLWINEDGWRVLTRVSDCDEYDIVQNGSLFFFHTYITACNSDEECDCEEACDEWFCKVLDVSLNEDNTWKMILDGPCKGNAQRIMGFLPTLHPVVEFG